MVSMAVGKVPADGEGVVAHNSLEVGIPSGARIVAAADIAGAIVAEAAHTAGTVGIVGEAEERASRERVSRLLRSLSSHHSPLVVASCSRMAVSAGLVGSQGTLLGK